MYLHKICKHSSNDGGRAQSTDTDLWSLAPWTVCNTSATAGGSITMTHRGKLIGSSLRRFASYTGRSYIYTYVQNK